MKRVGQNGHPLEKYYRWHARIYDASRRFFLFGREALINNLAADSPPARILEVGCGTGTNLAWLRQTFPGAALTGVDLSPDMLAVARKKLARLEPRVELQQQVYDRPLSLAPFYDLVLFSYALSLFNPGWEEAISSAHKELVSGGRIAVVDFHDSTVTACKRWLALNHVRMESHLLPELRSRFFEEFGEIRRAYGGAWSYFLFIGKKA